MHPEMDILNIPFSIIASGVDGLPAHSLFSLPFDVLPQHTVYLLTEIPLILFGKSADRINDLRRQRDNDLFPQRAI